MKDSCYNHMTIGLRRMLCIAVVVLLLTATLAGCGKKPQETTPSTNDSMLELEEPTTEPIEETPTETDPTSETIDPELLNIRSAPSMDGSVIGHLQPGAKVDILREEVVGGIRWALIREGWICIQYLEEYQGPDGIITGDTSGEDTTPTQAATQPGGTGAGNNNTGTGTGNGNGTGNVTGAGTGTATNYAGTITASELNIRTQPDQNSDRVGMYHRGDHVTILETKNGWGRTDKGWISLTYVYKDGTTGQNSCKGVITGNGLNIRKGPGTNYDSVGSYNYGTRVNILERIQIGQKWWGCTDKGWISMDYVYVDGTKGEGSGFGTVSGDGVNIRSGPGTNFDVVGTLNKGTDLDILFQITIGDMTWGCIKQGWVSMTYVGMG